MCIRTRWPVVRRTVMVCVVALMVHGAALPPTLLAQGRPGLRDECRVDTSFINVGRKITGAVAVECVQPHSPPWGNWGVTSNTGGRRDADQFSGWKSKGGHRQWNSCTTNYPWRPTDPRREEFYSHPPIQKSAGESTHALNRMRV